jgi:sulfite oxidase
VALSGGGRTIERVELTLDGGRSWSSAKLEAREPGGTAAAWSWRPWSASIDVAAGAHELAVRAWDSAGQTQPATVAEVWNFKGYMNNAWFRVAFTAA